MTKSEIPYRLKFTVAPGSFISEHMEYYGYTFEKFADLCGCSANSVKEIVIDKKPLTMKLAKKLERELDIPAYALMRAEKRYRSLNHPKAKVKVREKKTPLVQHPFSVAQQFG